MKKLWIAASIVAALSVLAVGAVKLTTTTSTPVEAAMVHPSIPTPPGCTSTRLQIPTAQGLKWYNEQICGTSD